MNLCNLCGKNTIIAGTFLLYTSYRCEDKDYIILKEEGSRKRTYYEIVRYCPKCLLKYCVGVKEE